MSWENPLEKIGFGTSNAEFSHDGTGGRELSRPGIAVA
jgi:hypothetical protein